MGLLFTYAGLILRYSICSLRFVHFLIPSVDISFRYEYVTMAGWCRIVREGTFTLCEFVITASEFVITLCEFDFTLCEFVIMLCGFFITLCKFWLRCEFVNTSNDFIITLCHKP